MPGLSIRKTSLIYGSHKSKRTPVLRPLILEDINWGNRPGMYKVDSTIGENIKILRQIPHDKVAIVWDQCWGNGWQIHPLNLGSWKLSCNLTSPGAYPQSFVPNEDKPDPVPISNMRDGSELIGAETFPANNSFIRNWSWFNLPHSSASLGNGYGLVTVLWYLLIKSPCYLRPKPSIPLNAMLIISGGQTFPITGESGLESGVWVAFGLCKALE